MNEMNFRNLENLQVPDELMDKLLAIPETAEKKPAAIPWWHSRSVIAAASLVLVSALSLLLYLNFGVKPPVEVKPSTPATEIVWSTDVNGETVATEVVIVPEGETRSDGTQPTEPKSLIEQLINTIFGTGDTSPTTPTGNGRGGRTTPTTKTSPTDGKTNPSQSAITPTQGVEPEKPTVQPTEPEPIVPTEPPDEPEPIEPTDPMEPPGPEEPSDPPWEYPDPTELPDEYKYTDTITEVIFVGELEEGNVIYCWLYNNNRRMYNDDAYTAMFYADVTPLGDGYAQLSYTPKAHGVVLAKSGSYRYLWYLSEDGGRTGRRLTDGYVNLKN